MMLFKMMDVFCDYGIVVMIIIEDVEGVKYVLVEVEWLGLDFKGVIDRLVEEGVVLFVKVFDDLFGLIVKK